VTDAEKLGADARRAVLRRLLREARPYYPRLAFSFVLGAIAGLGPLAYATGFQIVFDKVLTGPRDLRILWEVVAALFAINVISGFATYGQNYLTAWSGQRLIATLRVRLFERVMRLPLSVFDRWRPGEFLSRFTNDLNLMTDAASIALPQMFQTVVTFVGAVVYLLYTDWLLTLGLVFFAPAVNFVVARFTKLISSGTRRAQERIADLSSNLTEIIGAERVVKAFGREGFESARFLDRNEAYFGAYMKLTQLQQTQTPIVSIIITIALLAIVVFSSREVLVGRLTPGEVFRFWALVTLVINPLNRFATYVGDLSKGLIGASRVFEVLDLPIESDPPGAVPIASVKGAIAFEHVGFSYDDGHPAVLSDLSFRVEPGEIVALVGPSGAGKTTIVNLVPRFYIAQSGRVCVDGADVAMTTLESLRAAIAIVPQEPTLFSATIAENIRYGRLDATRAEIEAAAREANAEEFVLDLPHGYDTEVGERGVRLSGGQRQRIAIARAVLRDPRILILDEATSALDSHSERLIEAALDRLLPGRTTLIIAHRLSTVRRAGTILYVEGGRVLESGPHEELLAKNGRYAQLHAAQFAVK
jgi:subfamily B ATP-binding cassette protein MsbA